MHQHWLVQGTFACDLGRHAAVLWLRCWVGAFEKGWIGAMAVVVAVFW